MVGDALTPHASVPMATGGAIAAARCAWLTGASVAATDYEMIGADGGRI